MANQNISPEERLLKVIQEGKNNPPEDEGVKDGKKAAINLREIKLFFANLKPGGASLRGFPGTLAVDFPAKIQEIDPKAVNKALVIMLGLLVVLVTHYAVNRRADIQKIDTATSLIHYKEITEEPIEMFEPLSFYLEETKRRNIFRPAPLEKKVESAPRQRTVVDKFKEKAADLTLQGVSWGETPKVMIKSAKEDKMYFLKKGQRIGTTGIEIGTILKDKVIIVYGEEEMELQ